MEAKQVRLYQLDIEISTQSMFEESSIQSMFEGANLNFNKLRANYFSSIQNINRQLEFAQVLAMNVVKKEDLAVWDKERETFIKQLCVYVSV